MTLRLHWSPDSANLVVRIALMALNLPFETVRVYREKSEHKAPDYLSLNPQGLLPVIEDGGIVLFETGAILWHLAERAGRVGPDGPSMDEPAARAAALKWLFYISNTVHADLRAAFYADRYVDDEAALPSLRRGLRARLRGHCDMIERLLTTDAGLCGAAVSLPDIYLAVCLRWAQLYPSKAPVLAALSDWPRVCALCARVEAQPGARRAFEAEMIPAERAITAPRRPILSPEEVLGRG